MSIAIAWADPAQTLIHLEFKPGWKWSDLYAAISQADTMIGSVTHKVNLLIDIRKAGSIPVDFITAAGDIFTKGEARANEGQRVVLGANWLMRTAYSSFLTVYGHKLNGRAFQFAGSLDEARKLLKSAG